MKNCSFSSLLCVIVVLASAFHHTNAEPTVYEFFEKLLEEYESVIREQRQQITERFAEDADAMLEDLNTADPDDIEVFIETARLRLNQALLLVQGDLGEQTHLARLSAQELHNRAADELAASGRADNTLDDYYLDDIVGSVKANIKLAIGGWLGVRDGYLSDLDVTFDEVRRIAAEYSDAYAFADEVRTLLQKSLESLDVDLEAMFQLTNVVRILSVNRLRADLDILLR